MTDLLTPSSSEKPQESHHHVLTEEDINVDLTIPLGPIVRTGTVNEVAPMRQRLLGWRTSVNDLDIQTSTRHFIVEDDNACVGIVSVGLQEIYTSPAARLYAIALNPEYRGGGWGSQLLEYCANYAIEHNVDMLWAKARKEAWGFFEQHDFVAKGTPVLDPNIGPGSVGYVQQIMTTTV